MKKGLKIVKISLLSFISLIMLIFVIIGCILHGRISSMMSIKQVGDGFYTMNYQQNYHLDKAIKSNIKNADDLFKFACDEMLFGIKVDMNLYGSGCSAFLTESPDGDYLVGRNLDLPGSDTLALFTHPKGGYASISTVSTNIISVGKKNGISPTSLKGRMALLLSPYMCLDGVNEKGLTVSLLDQGPRETHMDTENPELIVSLAVRLLLDKAATVDEAVALLEKHDMHSVRFLTQHIFIADKSGNSVIVEWFHNQMKVVKYHVCTNFRMSSEEAYAGQCERFDYLANALDLKKINTVEESMSLLEGVKQNSAGTHTVWSVVFNLNDFNADYAVNMNYDKVYHINPRTDSKEGAIMSLPIIGSFLILCVSIFFIFYKKKNKKNLEDSQECNEKNEGSN